MGIAHQKVGIVGYIFIAIVSLHCMLVLVKCKKRLLDSTTYIKEEPPVEEDISKDDGIGLDSTPPSSEAQDFAQTITFEDVGFFTFGKWGKLGVDICLLSSQLGFCIVYTIFVGDNMHTLVPVLSKLSWMILWTPIFVGMCWIRHLKYLAPFSLAAVLIYLAGYIGVLYKSVDQPKFMQSPFTLGPLDFTSFLTFFSLAIYAFEGIGLVLPVESATKDKSMFHKLFLVGILIVSIVYVSVGTIGYISWGALTQSTLILNVAEDGLTPFYICLTVGFLAAATFTYPLMMWPVIVRLENLILGDGSSEDKGDETALIPDTTQKKDFPLATLDDELFCSGRGWKRNLIRAGLTLAALAFGIAIPAFELFTQLIGSLFSTTLAFTIPSLMHMKLFTWGPNPQLPRIHLVKDIAIFVFGLAAMVLCTAVTIYNIYVAAMEGKIHWNLT